MKNIIIFSVCFVHFLFLSILLFKSPLAPVKKQHRPLVVKTFVAPSPVPRIAEKKPPPASIASVARISSPQSPTPAAKKPQESKKAPLEKKPEPKKETPPVKKPSAPVEKAKPKPPSAFQSSPAASISPSLLQELEESIAKMESKSDKQKLNRKTSSKTVLPLPLQIDLPGAEPWESLSDNSDYISTLTDHLHASLHLPEFGEVKIELILRQDGTVAKLKVLKAESQQNRKYLESHLPLLKFPHFSGSFAKKQEQAFTLTFCNEL